MKQGWEYKRFEACINKTPKPKQVKTEEYNSGTKYPIVSQEDKLISGYYDDESYVFHIDSPVVIFGDHTRVLKYIDFDFVVGADGVKIISPKQELDAKFLLYYLQWYKIPNLGYSRHYKLLKEIQISIPPKSTQLSIVSELDKINELIRLKKEQLKDCDNLAQSIFYEMFGDPVENDKGWEVKKLGEVGQIVTGTTPSTNEESNWNGNINWVTPAELGTQLYYGETIRRISTNAAKKLTLMPVGTVLLSTRAPIGKLAITKVPMCCNQGFKNIICCQDLNNIFLYFYLLLTMDKIKAMGRGATFKEVSKQAISHYLVPLPPLPLQHLFAQRIEQIERQKSAVTKAITDLETLLASRMQHWFE